MEEGLAGPEPRTDEELIRLGSLLSEIESRAMTRDRAAVGANVGLDGEGATTRGERP